MMVGESWEVFTKRVLIEKHIRDIMYENLGGHGPLLLTPMLPGKIFLPSYLLILFQFQLSFKAEI